MEKKLVEVIEKGKQEKYFWNKKHYLDILKRISIITNDNDLNEFIDNNIDDK